MVDFEKPPLDDDPLDEEETLLRDNFASIVGSCLYFSITCRPDIATVVNKACKGMHDPKKIHILYLKALMKYLKNHKDVKLRYSSTGPASSVLQSLSRTYIELGVLDSSPIVGFSDANHLDKIIDGGMYSTSGNCFLCYGNLVAWSSKKQTIHASSSMQSELIAASTAADTGVWLHGLMTEFPVLFGVSGKVPPVPLLIDNQACLSVANHPDNSHRTRHIALREFRIRDYVANRQIRPYWCPGTHNLADHFTKALKSPLFQRLSSAMGMSGLSREEFMPLLDSKQAPKTHDGMVTEWFS